MTILNQTNIQKVNSNKDFYIVGIGASAGGLEAIEAFFSKVPADSGLAFVIIQHLSPDYKSLMPEILIKRTSLPVHTAEDGMMVEPNNVYLIPRKMNMKVFHSRLHLTEKQDLHILNLPIDIFLRSLAEDFEEKAIAVILSGTGSDGSRGIRVIKENGGMIIAHDPDTAKFDGMPRSAITTGTVDFVLSPESMPEKIISYVKHPYIKDIDKTNEIITVPEDYMTKIVLLLKENFGLDFTYYKSTTLSRRIERRLSINQLDSLKEYLDYLFSSKNEQKILYKELLIGVTKFFRDTEAFEFIESEVIPDIFKEKRPNDEVRIWISACSTGEEAYSVAILFKEYMLEHDLNNDIKIFATDVDKTAIDLASNGTYNASISADVSPSRLERFFVQSGDVFHIKEEIREMIVFASHNIIKDPPFNKIDFLTCRNLLIYFQHPLQQKVLSLFSFSLNRSGFLFLGNSETIGEMEQYFESVNLKWKIFKARQNMKLNPDALTSKFPSIVAGNIVRVPRPPVYAVKSSVTDLVSIFTEKMLEDNAPDTVIVNQNGELINTYGDPNKYLIFPKTKKITEGFEYSITKMVPSNLKLVFNISISKALKSEQEVIYHNIKFTKNETENLVIDLRFVPLKYVEGNTRFVMIYFIKKEIVDVATTNIKEYEDIDQQAQQRIQDLETELKHTKENLQASIEELETTNEELQSTNEELISANEELQSTNEELQSVNEELYTVNTEFQAKNHDLTVMNNDIENLLQNSEIRIIFLDIELKIRKFTENITDIFNLKKNDTGRPISDITHNILDTDLLLMVKNIVDRQKATEKVVQVRSRWYQMKVEAYKTQKGFLEGVVISFIDVSNFYQAKNELIVSQARYKTVISMVLDAFYLLDSKYDLRGRIVDFTIVDVNEQAEKQMGMSANELIGKGVCELFPVNLENGFFDKYRKVVESGVAFDEEYCIPNKFAAPGWYYHQVVPTETGVAIFNRDISLRKNIENEIVEKQSLYHALFQHLQSGFALHEILVDENNQPYDYKFIEINASFEAITGLKRSDVIGKSIKQVIPNIEEEWISMYGDVALNQSSKKFEMESKILNKKFKVNAFSPQKGQFATLFEEIKLD